MVITSYLYYIIFFIVEEMADFTSSLCMALGYLISFKFQFTSSSALDYSPVGATSPLHQCASYPTLSDRPKPYRGGRQKEPPPKNISDMNHEELAHYTKERQKKDNHNESKQHIPNFDLSNCGQTVGER